MSARRYHPTSDPRRPNPVRYACGCEIRAAIVNGQPWGDLHQCSLHGEGGAEHRYPPYVYDDELSTPEAWAEWLYERLNGDLLGAAYYGRTQLLPTEVYSAWEAGELTAQQLEWWWSRTSARWRELADNPRARWLDAIHAYGPSFAPLGEMFPQYVDSHDPACCLACQAYGRAKQRDIVAAVAARAMAIWPYVPTDPTDGLWLIHGETARGPYRSRAAAELAATQLGGRVREARFGCWQPEPAKASRS